MSTELEFFRKSLTCICFKKLSPWIKNVIHYTDCAYLFQFLTDEDFKKIRLREAARQIDPKAGKKRKRGADHAEPSERSVLCSHGHVNVFSFSVYRSRIENPIHWNVSFISLPRPSQSLNLYCALWSVPLSKIYGDVWDAGVQLPFVFVVVLRRGGRPLFWSCTVQGKGGGGGWVKVYFTFCSNFCIV